MTIPKTVPNDPPLSQRGVRGDSRGTQYRPDLKQKARSLRSNLTDAEQKLWAHLRRKQLDGVQFYRQRPIGSYIVDFYAPSVDLVVELDGSQHATAKAREYDERRTRYLGSLGLRVLRFDDRRALLETRAVLEVILHAMLNRRESQA